MRYRTETPEGRERLIQIMVEGIRSKMDIGIIGVSGGADSTLVTILTRMALGANNVFAISMPFGQTDYATFNSRSARLAEHLGVQHTECNIYKAWAAFAWSRNLSDLQGGNLRSRCRMVELYLECGILSEENPGQRCRVVGTGNLSEDYIGFDTKGGDALCDYFPIGGLYKQEVYDLLDHFKAAGVITEDMIDRIPSAGLWEGQTDEGELGHSYNDMAPAVKLLSGWQVAHTDEEVSELVQSMIDAEVPDPTNGAPWPLVSFVWKRHIANKHKHIGPETCPLPKIL